MIFGEVLTAMVTPFDEDLGVDYEGAVRLAKHLIENGSDSLLILGTTGEVPTLSSKEKELLLEVLVDEVGGECKIVAGTGSNCTESTIAFTKRAEEIGVDGVMLVTPYYNKPPQKGLYQHFKAVANETNLPVIIYNVPGRSAANIEPQTVARLAKIDNIVAIKEASGCLDQAIEIRSLTEDDFMIYSGDDGLTLPILSIGGVGVISVASHVAGSQIKEMIGDFKAGRLAKAAKKNAELNKLFNTIFMITNPIPVKAALNLIGQQVGGLRPPLLPLDEGEQEELESVLKEYDLI